MPVRYIAYTAEGARVTGEVEGDEIQAAEAQLFQQGLTVISLKKWKRPQDLKLWLAASLPTLYRVKNQDIVYFCRQLVNLLDSGLPILQAISILHGQVHHPMFKRALELVSADIESGKSLSEALARHPNVFSSLLVRLVRVGEETGRLQPLIEQVADYMEKQAAFAARVKKALTYPAIIMVMGFIVLFVLITFSIPAMAKLVQEYGGQLPLTTRILLATSNFVSTNLSKLFLLTLCLGVVAYLYYGRPVNRPRRARLTMNIPVLNHVILAENLSRFSYSLSFLLSAGIGFTEALDLLLTTIENPVIGESLRKVRSGVLTGQRLSQTLSTDKLFPPVFTQMVAVGEETGRLESNLSLLGKIYEADTNQSLSRLTSFIEPAIIIGVGLMVGFIAISMMGTIYGMISQMKV